MTAYKIEATVDDLTSEDSGVYLIAYGLGDDTCPLYVHLLSEAEDPAAPDAHADLRRLDGKRIRVTIEEIEAEV